MKNMSIASTLLTAFLAIACASNEEPKNEVPATPSNLVIKEVVSQARIEPEGKIANLSTPVAGIVEKVLKSENEQLQLGEVIVVLQHDIEQAKLAQLQSRDNMQAAKIDAAKLELAEYNTRLTNKEKEFKRLSALLSKGSETQQRVDDTETELNVLRTSAQKATANIVMARAERQEIQNQIALAKVELDQRFIKAPGAGQLLSITAVPGAALDTQNSFAEFAPNGNLVARAEVDELFAGKIQVGQPASLRLVGGDETIATGKVIFTASTLKRKSLFSEKAGDQEDRRVREIKVALDGPTSLLINSRVECVIQIGK